MKGYIVDYNLKNNEINICLKIYDSDNVLASDLICHDYTLFAFLDSAENIDLNSGIKEIVCNFTGLVSKDDPMFDKYDDMVAYFKEHCKSEEILNETASESIESELNENNISSEEININENVADLNNLENSESDLEEDNINETNSDINETNNDDQAEVLAVEPKLENQIEESETEFDLNE